mmetsp:Transcript_76708/g.213202  ORF Transcript_76708/g.213202 Transcript_76708/m.213202 type:complete len:231 (+) Transcript_76708:81-773(+)
MAASAVARQLRSAATIRRRSHWAFRRGPLRFRCHSRRLLHRGVWPRRVWLGPVWALMVSASTVGSAAVLWARAAVLEGSRRTSPKSWTMVAALPAQALARTPVVRADAAMTAEAMRLLRRVLLQNLLPWTRTTYVAPRLRRGLSQPYSGASSRRRSLTFTGTSGPTPMYCRRWRATLCFGSSTRSATSKIRRIPRSCRACGARCVITVRGMLRPLFWGFFIVGALAFASS